MDTSGSNPNVWTVYRQDDNGNVFEVARGLSEAEARKLAAELESHGHKQLYWVSREDRSSTQ